MRTDQSQQSSLYISKHQNLRLITIAVGGTDPSALLPLSLKHNYYSFRSIFPLFFRVVTLLVLVSQ